MGVITIHTDFDFVYDVIEVRQNIDSGKYVECLFSNFRENPQEIKDRFPNLYVYEIRGDDEGNLATVEKDVYVNYAGAIITKYPIDFRNRDYLEFFEETYPDFTGDEMTIEEYATK